MRRRSIALASVLAWMLVACTNTDAEQGIDAPASSPSEGDGELATAPAAELYAPLMSACLEDAGFEVEILDDGGIFVPHETQEEQGRYDGAFEQCLAATGFDLPSGISPEEEYRQLLAQDDCYREQGYPVDSPTFEEFQAGLFPDYAAVLPQDDDELDALIEACG